MTSPRLCNLWDQASRPPPISLMHDLLISNSSLQCLKDSWSPRKIIDSQETVLSSEIISDVVYNAWKENELITHSCIAAYSEMKFLGGPSYFLWPPHKLLTSFIHCRSSAVVLSLKLYFKDGGRSRQSMGQFLWELLYLSYCLKTTKTESSSHGYLKNFHSVNSGL